jgi:hypothetical protein
MATYPYGYHNENQINAWQNGPMANIKMFSTKKSPAEKSLPGFDKFLDRS